VSGNGIPIATPAALRRADRESSDLDRPVCPEIFLDKRSRVDTIRAHLHMNTMRPKRFLSDADPETMIA